MPTINKRDKLGKILKGNNERHGMSDAPEYDCWVAMKARCTKESHPSYALYGGRGISVCERWMESFDNFIADMGSSNGLTLDRTDVNGNYEPSNCRWIPHHLQQINRRNNNSCPGVWFEKSRAKWIAEIKYLGKKTFIGRFDTQSEAYAARLTYQDRIWNAIH